MSASIASPSSLSEVSGVTRPTFFMNTGLPEAMIRSSPSCCASCTRKRSRRGTACAACPWAVTRHLLMASRARARTLRCGSSCSFATAAA